MRFMMLIYPGKQAEVGGGMPDAKTVAAMMKYNEELAKAGVLLALDGLHPSSKGARILFSDGEPRVIDGPFTEAKEIIGGYWLLQVRSKEEAVEWGKRCPLSDEFLELRQVFDMSDFPADVQAAADSPTVREAIEKPKA
jgi:hypothetical protein